MITISGEPKEIAALVVALQERQISVNFNCGKSISDAVRDTLTAQAKTHDSFIPETADGPCLDDGISTKTTHAAVTQSENERSLLAVLGDCELRRIGEQIAEIVRQHDLQQSPDVCKMLFSYMSGVIEGWNCV